MQSSDIDASAMRRRRAELERERLRLQEEIVGYPMPIPACDVFFNDLLERRAQVCAELTDLERALASSAPG